MALQQQRETPQCTVQRREGTSWPLLLGCSPKASLGPYFLLACFFCQLTYAIAVAAIPAAKM